MRNRKTVAGRKGVEGATSGGGFGFFGGQGNVGVFCEVGGLLKKNPWKGRGWVHPRECDPFPKKKKRTNKKGREEKRERNTR